MPEAGIRGIAVDECGELELELSITSDDGVEHTARCWVSREFLEVLIDMIDETKIDTEDPRTRGI